MSLFARLVGLIDGPDATLRVELAAAQLVGVALLRYLLRVEPLASAPIEQLVILIAPTLDVHLQSI